MTNLVFLDNTRTGKVIIVYEHLLSLCAKYSDTCPRWLDKCKISDLIAM